MLDLLLVNPGNLISQFGGVSEYATIAQPLGLAMLAAYVREHGFTVEILDAEVLRMDADQTVDYIIQKNPRFMGITAFTTKMTAAGHILKLLKKRRINIKTIIGGHHPSAIPEDTYNSERVDFVVKGEGYHPLVNILNGTAISPIQIAEPMKNIDDLPLPAWDLLPMDKYRAHHWQTWGYGRPNSFALVYTSLGCPFQCKFCSVSNVYGKRIYRQKTPERTMKDFDQLHDQYHTKHIEIIDDTFTLNKKHAEAVCELLIERDYGFNMWAFSRVDTSTPRLYEKMKAAGINWVFMGVEAGNEDILDGVVKLSNLEKIKNAIHIAHEAGIHVGTNYVFGLENETQTTMQETLALAMELCTEWANFFIAMPYPGTEMYQKADQSQLPEEWEQYGFFAPNAKPLPTKTLTSEQIIQFRDAAFYLYYSNERYQNMIEEQFGKKQYIQEMLQRRIGRK
jgi:anaerobic magnesium-protoporphyrin IX monomethyl ester cyclase